MDRIPIKNSTHRIGSHTFPSRLGDFDGDGGFEIDDIDLLQARILDLYSDPSWLPDAMFDLNNDGNVTQR
ncbi:MAG: hypothetical protein R3C28_31715 [Pirellulaceae bacterium]